MTKEELKEAIAATITENGQKGITGQALANLLNEIVDAAGSGSGGGGGGASNVLYLDMAGTDGPNEHNAQIFKTIWEGSANGVCYQICYVSSGDGFCNGMTSIGYLGMDGLGLMISFVLYQQPEPIWIAIELKEDGSIIETSQETV